ncbi:hypothetical protein DERF_010022 [Dermatophagoides farinae]|uniref:Uncharacterized protein n=1 Tax=Dermatophagoides farinae TaxID=6954 RepID=A0A922HXS1_DERFA|nr:hypothetical protein DERF_010022 [Dermatophagoides farinae]
MDIINLSLLKVDHHGHRDLYINAHMFDNSNGGKKRFNCSKKTNKDDDDDDDNNNNDDNYT